MVMIQAGARRCCARMNASIQSSKERTEMRFLQHGHRVCVAACYNAKGPDCQCICGGLNHGQGVIKAASNAYGMADRILREATGQLSLELGAVRS